MGRRDTCAEARRTRGKSALVYIFVCALARVCVCGVNVLKKIWANKWGEGYGGGICVDFKDTDV